MNAYRRATFAAAATGMLVGAAMVSTRAVASDTSPVTLAFLRYAIGVCVLGAAIFTMPRTRFRFVDAAAVCILGIFQFGILIVQLNYALETLPAATCALVFSTMPLFTMSLATILGREVFSTGKLLGILVAIGGVCVLLLLPSAGMGAERIELLPLAALVGATVTGAVCSVLYGRYLGRYPALPTSTLAMAAAVIFLTCLCVSTGQALFPSLSAMQWANVGFIGLSSGLGYFCWLWALAKIDASRVVAFQALGPVTAAAIELFLLRRLPSWQLLLAIALVIAGLLLACLKRHERRV